MEHPTRLDLPKGHVDGNETDIKCALRELEEETGITASDIEIDPEFQFSTQYEVRPKKENFAPCKKTLVIFLARLNREVEIKLTEHIGFQWQKWLPPHEFGNPTIDGVLGQLADYLAK